MRRNINNQFDKYVFSVSRSFVGSHLIGAYHTAIRPPYCNPLIHDTLWQKVKFVFIVVKGSIRFWNKESEFKVGENQIFFGETGNDVCFVDDGIQAEFYSFYFQTFNCSLPEWTPYSLADCLIDEENFELLLNYMRMKSEVGLGLANGLFTQLLFKCLQEIQARETNSMLHGKAILEAQLYINENVEEKLTVGELAQKYHFSEKHFRYLFAKVIGMSPKKYIEKVKLEHAYGLLKNTSLTVSEISEKLGFSSVRHFVTYFKKAYEITPSKCRKEII